MRAQAAPSNRHLFRTQTEDVPSPLWQRTHVRKLLQGKSDSLTVLPDWGFSPESSSLPADDRRSKLLSARAKEQLSRLAKVPHPVITVSIGGRAEKCETSRPACSVRKDHRSGRSIEAAERLAR